MTDNFSADLDQLDHAAREDMPLLAKTYAAAFNQIGGTDQAVKDIVKEPAICANAVGFTQEWVSLVNTLGGILSTARDDATRIGQQLAHVVDTYAATNDQIRAQIQAITDSLSK